MAWIVGISVFLLLYAYGIYPLLLHWLARNKSLNYAAYERSAELPPVYIIIPAHNEAKVIGTKLRSVLDSDYPANKIQVILGLDQCTDETGQIAQAIGHEHIRLIDFQTRMGKPSLVNALVAQVSDPDAILVLTDADILFQPDTLFQLVRYFKDPRVGLVDTRVEVLASSQAEEQQYAGFETRLKMAESRVFGRILGPSGGCYAIRRHLFAPVPPNFLVDDLYIGIEIVLGGQHAILNPEAVCTEEKHSDWSGEFRRKVRIATGSFQNLWRFKGLLLQPFRATGFIFLSHKVLRWKTPFLLLAVYAGLLCWNPFVILIITFFLPFIVGVFGTLGWQIKPLYAIFYFVSMNMAVLAGFFNCIKGVSHNVWQPTSR